MIRQEKLVTPKGTVTSNDGDLALVTMPSTETLKVYRYGTQTEEDFRAKWRVGKEITVGL